MVPKFLDDDITLSIALPSVVTSNLYVTYYVKRLNIATASEETVFVGKYYLMKDDTKAVIDISDIVRNYRYIYDFSDTVDNLAGKNLYTRWTVSFVYTGLSCSSEVLVWHTYNYTHSNFGNVVDYEYNFTDDCYIMPNLETTYLSTQYIDDKDITHYIYSTKVLPRYPFKLTTNFYFRQSMYFTMDADNTLAYGFEDDTNWSEKSFPYYGSSDFSIRLYDLTNGTYSNTHNTLYFTHSGMEWVKDYWMPMAVFDKCPAHYYLQWQDRLGGIQCQPFQAKDVYSESFTYTSCENYRGHKRNITTEIEPKWELTTKWLDDTTYIVFEGIFQSPYILLYDTELDKTYKVIVSDTSYTEKNTRNQRNIYKMTLNVKLDKNQYILA